MINKHNKMYNKIKINNKHNKMCNKIIINNNIKFNQQVLVILTNIMMILINNKIINKTVYQLIKYMIIWHYNINNK